MFYLKLKLHKQIEIRLYYLDSDPHTAKADLIPDALRCTVVGACPRREHMHNSL